MKNFEYYGKFLATADRLTWVDVTRASSFNIQKRALTERDVSSALDNALAGITSVWVVYCNLDRNSELVAVFSSESEARNRTQEMLITVFGRSQGVVQPNASLGTGSPARPVPNPKAG